jgi:hypothetical protein
VIEWTITTSGKCRRLADVPKGARIEAINGREVWDYCEACARPILDGQEYHYDSEGMTWHVRCRHGYAKPGEPK